MKNNYNKKQAFTIVELVIVIAVIAVLASVLIPTFSNIVNKANESKAMQEAKHAWNEVAYTYVAGYKGFAASGTDLNGWYYDIYDEVAKYDYKNQYTIHYNGESFKVLPYENNNLNYGEITSSSIDYNNYTLSNNPMGLNITYYNSIYSRGFAWVTDTNNVVTNLYITESKDGALADFDNALLVEGTSQTLRYEGAEQGNKSILSSTLSSIEHSINSVELNVHKVHIENLNPNTVYSYKVGGNDSYLYGRFKVEVENPSTITAIQMSDAQTLDPTQLNVWENTFAQAVNTAGRNLDMILFNGDQFDQRMTTSHEAYLSGNYPANSMPHFLRYSMGIDTISTYRNSLPYMSSEGNHEPYAPKVQSYQSDIKYPNNQLNGYYSYDYNFAHFVVLNTNDLSVAQTNWLKSDLSSASSNSNIKWIIVMMHMGAYATGDHSDSSMIREIIETLTPIFSKYHVDLVLQAHDHTYNKTLPYLWNNKGYSTVYSSTDLETQFVNLNITKTSINNITYDTNPFGTYYVTTGAAGHRVGKSEMNDGVWADVALSNEVTSYTYYDALTTSFKQLKQVYNDTTKTYLNNKYKIEVGQISVGGKYNAYPFDGTIHTYNIGDPATANIDRPMFGILELTKETLIYKFYTVSGTNVQLFDEIKVLKK